jgi:hydrogenase nickel incorporation protein HypB
MRDVAVERKVLGRNDLVAQRNRERFKSLGAYVVNLISSPGAGKTTLLEATLRQLAQTLSVAVIEGDVQTDNDARRVAATGVPVEAVVTGGACHLDASMVGRAFAALEPKLGRALDLLIVENVGNLVCPASYDVGEDEKIALVSVTEGEDKPLKYPALFHAAKTCLVTKVDLLPHLDFDYDALLRNTRAVNPDLKIFALSARTSEGMAEWLSHLTQMTNRSNP